MRQLNVIERFLLAPLKDDSVAVETRYIPLVRQNLTDCPFQTRERCCDICQDFNAVSNLETWHIRLRADGQQWRNLFDLAWKECQ